MIKKTADLKYYKKLIQKFQGNRIADQLFFGIMAAVVVAILFIGHYWTSFEARRFRLQSEEMKQRFVNDQKNLARHEVTRALDFINYSRSMSQERMNSNLRQRVDEAWDIANNIYIENNGKKSSAEIEKMIKDALRPIRFSNARGDIFIYTTGGVSVLLPRSKHRENTSSIHYKDDYGNYVVRNEVELIKKMDQGFLHYYVPSGDNDADSILLKSTYIRKFHPYNWYLGSKDYLEDYEQDLKNDILEYLSRVRYGNEGYLFVNTIDGKALITNGVKHLTPQYILESGDSNRIRTYLKQVNVYRSTGSGFIEYTFKRLVSEDSDTKISYLGSLKEWGWIVGAGFYENEIQDLININRKEMQQQVKRAMLHIIISLLVVLVFIWLVSRWISRRLAMGFSLFKHHFRKANDESVEIDPGNLIFAEFRELATSVNRMMDERNIARKSLEKERSLLRSLIDSSPDLIFFKDMESRFVGCNKAFADYLGLEEQDMVGHTDADFYSYETAETYLRADKKILSDRIPIRSEEWITFPDGRRRLMDTLKVLNFDNAGEPVGIVAISRDITEREEIQQKYIEAKEKAEESDRLKTAFLANMSHEIRTPLNSIIGFSNLLADEDIPASDKTEFVKHINHGSENLLNLIDDIIDIAKIEAGQLTVSMEPCNLTDLMEEIFQVHSEILKKKGKDHIVLAREYNPSPQGDMIMTDTLRLRQVLVNLIGNAIKFTNEGSITFGYSINDKQVKFVVKDTGIGISPEGLQVVFERFRQDTKHGPRHPGGTGLGLAISRHIVQLLGGDINVVSRQGEGSVFSFHIPCEAVPEIQEKGQPKTVKSKISDWSGKTLLVVEDVDSNYDYIMAALSRTGINILRARAGEEAVEICLSGQPVDIVLMDIVLPVADGYEATRKIRENKPSLPVIAQTAFGRPGDEELSREAGCSDYINKPIRFRTLIEVLGKYLNQS